MTMDTKALLAEAEALKTQLLTDRRTLHRDPEVGPSLPRTAAYVTERLTALPALPDCWIVLCKPEFGIPTPALFTLADAGTPKNRPDIDGMIRALSAGDLGGVAARLCNVFEEFLPEEYHEVFHIKNRLLELGALNAAMSGSGPTVFGIFREKTAAKAAETALKQCYPQTYLAKPVGELV